MFVDELNNINNYESKKSLLKYIDGATGKIKINQENPFDTIRTDRLINGLNIFGICENKDCNLNGKKIIYNTFYNIFLKNKPIIDFYDNPPLLKGGLHFCLNKELNNIICPKCKKKFKPKICGFLDCEYQLIGKKIGKNKELIEFDSKTREKKDNDLEYFGELSDEELLWKELNIYVMPKQKIKYEEDI